MHTLQDHLGVYHYSKIVASREGRSVHVSLQGREITSSPVPACGASRDTPSRPVQTRTCTTSLRRVALLDTQNIVSTVQIGLTRLTKATTQTFRRACSIVKQESRLWLATPAFVHARHFPDLDTFIHVDDRGVGGQAHGTRICGGVRMLGRVSLVSLLESSALQMSITALF